MTELERTKAALSITMKHLEVDAGFIKEHRVCLEEIDAILNPAPIMEEVEEVVGWVNVYQNSAGIYTSAYTYPNSDEADHAAVGHNRISCQPIKVTVQREKSMPVERSVTVEVTINQHGEPLMTARGLYANIGAQDPDAIGKRGTLTFAWTEEPTT